MSEFLDKNTLIPRNSFSSIFSAFVPSVTNPNMVTVGDPYVKITASDGKEYFTRSFNQSELLPKEKIKFSSETGFLRSSGPLFYMPIIEKFQEKDGKLVGFLTGNIRIDGDDGKHSLSVNNIQISNLSKEGERRYGATFASSKENVPIKTNVGRNILTSVLTKLPFIESIAGYRISGARRATGKASYAKLGADKINKVKDGLAKQGLINSFFTQADLTKDDIKNWMKKNNTGGVVAGVALSGNDPMQSLNVKGLGKAIDDPANFYLALAEGGLVDDIGDEFADLISFYPEQKRTVVDMDYLTRPL
jgi:hypothetical protein|tara:strand:+ start:79 stop:993 length:915 start_codon:yes stop_codon:yes gene_type:complete